MAFLLIICLLVSVYAMAEDAMEEEGYSFLWMEQGVKLRGEFKKQTLDVSLYGGKTVDQYALIDKNRNISIYQANNTKTSWGPFKLDLLDGTNASIIHWDKGAECPRPDAVDAMHNLQRAYEFYRDVLLWEPDIDGKPFEATVIVDVNLWRTEPGGKEILLLGNMETFYDENNNTVWFAVGQNIIGTRFLSGSPEVIGHEFTHMVLKQKGIKSEDWQSKAIHEGYGDVIGICIGNEGEKWVYADDYLTTKRDLEHTDFKHIKKTNSKKDAHDNGQLIGYAAYLMNKPDISKKLIADPFVDEETKKEKREEAAEQQGEALNHHQIAKIFYASMEHMQGNPTLRDMGAALSMSAKEMPAIISQNQAKRVDCVLKLLGLIDEPQQYVSPAEEEEMLNSYVQTNLIPQYGIMSTEILYDTESRTNNELSGILSANLGDYDGDGAFELLVNQFHVQNGAEIGPGISDELLLNMQMYELENGQVTLSADKQLVMLGLTEIMGRKGTSATGFSFTHGKEQWIAFDTFYGINQRTTTLTAYRYDGSRFVFVGGAGFQEYGEGSLLARYTLWESDWASVTNCSDWWAVLLGNPNRSKWQTYAKWDTEDHDWSLPSDEDRNEIFGYYIQFADACGVTVNNDQRIIPDNSLDDWKEQYHNRFTQDLDSIYAGTPGVKNLWSIVSFQRMDGPLELHREDPQGSLDAFR